MGTVCKIDGCERQSHAKSLCTMHYQRAKRGGELEERELARDLMERILEANKEEIECVIWPLGRTEDGYGRVKINGIETKVHQFACELAHGPKLEDHLMVRHLCGNGHLGCFNPKHLIWGTHQENVDDREKDGRTIKGSNHYATNLIEENVLEIYNSKLPSKVFEEKFNITKSVVSRIRNGKKWLWLTGHKKEGGD